MKISRRHRKDAEKLTPAEEETGFPANELAQLRQEIGRAYQSPFEDMLAPAAAALFEGWAPAFDLYEEKDKFTVKAEVPGMKKEDIEVSLNGNMLSISGERKEEEEHMEADIYRAERYFGRFQRGITLPQPVDPTQISAHYEDGVLTITLPKAEEAKRKQIDVKIS